MGNHSTRQGYVQMNIEDFHELVHNAQEEFPELSDTDVGRICGISKSHVSRLMLGFNTAKKKMDTVWLSEDQRQQVLSLRETVRNRVVQLENVEYYPDEVDHCIKTLLDEFPELTMKGIHNLCSLSHVSLHTIRYGTDKLRKDGRYVVKREHLETILGLADKLRTGQLQIPEKTSRSRIRIASEEDVEKVDKNKLKALVGDLSLRFDIGLEEIARLTNISFTRLRNLMYIRGHEFIRASEKKALDELAEKLQRGEVQYVNRNKGKNTLELVVDKSNLKQLVKALHDRFEVTYTAIAALAGMTRKRLEHLRLNEKYVGIRTEESRALCDLWEILEEAEMTSTVTSARP